MRVPLRGLHGAVIQVQILVRALLWNNEVHTN